MCPHSQQSSLEQQSTRGDPWALAGSFGVNGQHLTLVAKMEVPCDLHSVSVCSSDTATRRRREPGSCHWFAPGTQAPLDARRGWGRCTSPKEAGPWRGEGYHWGLLPPTDPLLLRLCPLLLGVGLGVCVGGCCCNKLPDTPELQTTLLLYPAALRPEVDPSGLTRVSTQDVPSAGHGGVLIPLPLSIL